MLGSKEEASQGASVQWIRRPTIRADVFFNPELQDDIDSLVAKLTDKDVGLVEDFMNLWTRNIQEVLDKLRDTIPGEGMLGEIHYWRDLNRILSAVDAEVKQDFVEITIQLFAGVSGRQEVYKQSLDKFVR